jgi:hypothetical protein
MGIEAVVHMAIEAGMAVKPGTGPDEHAAKKPIRPVVAIGSTVVGSVVKVPVGAHRRYSNADCNLGLRIVGRADKCNGESGQDKGLADCQEHCSIL